MMYGWSMHAVTALSGADWQGEPTPQCDGSLFPISQATALSQDREPSIFFHQREREKRDRGRQKREGEAERWKSLGTNKKKEALSSWVLHFPFQPQCFL